MFLWKFVQPPHGSGFLTRTDETKQQQQKGHQVSL